ncbi:hypothetical protein [Phnomibacter sp. MR]|uniref:hypothetical protein n=1 Tax=Phnomibacter sp. MR TaxID=3042318 RepID=UPI003A8018AD
MSKRHHSFFIPEAHPAFGREVRHACSLVFPTTKRSDEQTPSLIFYAFQQKLKQFELFANHLKLEQ